MPWVNEERCSGCGICVERCPAGAIIMKNDKAKIELDECIRCGTCSGACPDAAVEKDGSRIPLDVKVNMELTKRLQDKRARLLGDRHADQDFLGMMINFFEKEKKVTERTLEGLEALRD